MSKIILYTEFLWSKHAHGFLQHTTHVSPYLTPKGELYSQSLQILLNIILSHTKTVFVF